MSKGGEKPDPHTALVDSGIDRNLLEESLRMTPEQRAVRHQAALELALEMERAGRELRERPEPAAAEALRS